ncbi:ornithine carbamoyltransferase [Actinoalloteichus hymeniacidonis]|uniref:Ornithine carbamoyltransferase n=1 Tax=Actinoalloteichus hymeniacidonis TaxID=340345 RepID=A0AAC9HQK7_9PSEU|nr:ornithine carbamoyltransferase [Actinoalloteichus hymeniacidonis]AOS63792.1 ornithine carbamoyltransferase [Actinoalloteichus hymeniacidonis]MBB5908154.1 ornithine carbamoyltransferase/carbamoyltransferase [Actinoalloteichus hymeniacidonis]
MSGYRLPDPRRTDAHPGLLSIADLDPADFRWLVRRAGEFYRDVDAHREPLARRVVGVLFTKTSTRTRTAFSSAALRLGGRVIAYGPDDLQTNTGETWDDTARVFGSMLDVLVARTAGPLADLRRFAEHGGLPTVNAMAAEEHPTQALCDVSTLALAAPSGQPDGVRVLYVGEGNNTATAYAAAAALIPGSTTVFATPPGYGLPDGCLDAARARAADTGSGAQLVEVHDVEEAIAAGHDVGGGIDAVYTTRWQTTGTSKPDPDWRMVFAPFAVTQELLDRFPGAAFLHDLPAHRGEEVAAEVLDGPRSLAWAQARMKATSAMAVLEWICR